MILERINTRYHGRFLVKVPENYPGKRYQGLYAYEHQVVFWLHHGYLPPTGYHIHHINGDHTDNRIENLEAISAYEHSKYRHNGGKEAAKHDVLICNNCNKEFTQLERTVNYRLSTGQTEFYCSNSCNISASNRMRIGIKLNYPKNRKPSVEHIKLNCPACDKEFTIRPSNMRAKQKKGAMIFCSRPCVNGAIGRQLRLNKS